MDRVIALRAACERREGEGVASIGEQLTGCSVNGLRIAAAEDRQRRLLGDVFHNVFPRRRPDAMGETIMTTAHLTWVMSGVAVPSAACHMYLAHPLLPLHIGNLRHCSESRSTCLLPHHDALGLTCRQTSKVR